MTPYKKQMWKLKGRMVWHSLSVILYFCAGYWLVKGDYSHANFCLILNLYPMPDFLETN